MKTQSYLLFRKYNYNELGVEKVPKKKNHRNDI